MSGYFRNLVLFPPDEKSELRESADGPVAFSPTHILLVLAPYLLTFSPILRSTYLKKSEPHDMMYFIDT